MTVAVNHIDRIGALRAVYLRLAGRFSAARKAAEAQAARVKEGARRLLLARRELGGEAKVPGVAWIQRAGGKLPIVGLDNVDPETLPRHLTRVTVTPDAEARPADTSQASRSASGPSS